MWQDVVAVTETELHCAARSGDAAGVEVQLLMGAEVDAREAAQGFAPLHEAAYHGHTAAVAALLEAGAEVNLRANNGRCTAVEARQRFSGGLGFKYNTPLHLAARQGHEAVVAALLEGGADLEMKTEGGLTALLCAEQGGHTATAEVLRQTAEMPDRVVTLRLANGHGAGHVVICTSIGGTELAVVSVDVEQECLGSFWMRLAQELDVPRCRLRLASPGGQLLDEASSSVPLGRLLGQDSSAVPTDSSQPSS
mmetsp:Transcript_96735/g.282806  ORF Transcript_96735/g.282806 Transcript_96735/m.282806 type:complete len:252 (-) Transcript_96735:136-891(-)